MIKIEDAYKEFNTYVSEYDFDVLYYFDRLIEKFMIFIIMSKLFIKANNKYVI